MKNKTFLMIIAFILSAIWSFAQETETFTDSRDGNKYKTIVIGTQTWMAMNLAYLPAVNSAKEGSDTLKCYYVYDYEGNNVSDAKDSIKYSIFGVLYNWPAAMDGAVSSNIVPSGVKGACPIGWHLPSIAEWGILAKYLGGWDNAGYKMKSKDFLWSEGCDPSTNESGFEAFPSGDYSFNMDASIGHFKGLFGSAWYWSATDSYGHSPNICVLMCIHRGLGQGHSYRYDGYSVRCVKD
jgi:uncharacterized protein (TIGR02145 family)